jgi:hypothetical protein
VTCLVILWDVGFLPEFDVTPLVSYRPRNLGSEWVCRALLSIMGIKIVHRTLSPFSVKNTLQA